MLFCSAFKDETKLSDTCGMAIWGCGSVQSWQLNTSVSECGCWSEVCSCLGLCFSTTVYTNWIASAFCFCFLLFMYSSVLLPLLNVLKEWFSIGISFVLRFGVIFWSYFLSYLLLWYFVIVLVTSKSISFLPSKIILRKAQLDILKTVYRKNIRHCAAILMIVLWGFSGSCYPSLKNDFTFKFLAIWFVYIIPRKW